MIRPDPAPFASSTGASEAWSPVADRAITQAITKWNLDKVGWRGFESLPWVQALSQRYPDMEQIGHTCSTHDGKYKDEVRDLVGAIDRKDFADVRSYFVGKLALEELSCRMSGAGAGLCDKRGAFLDIFEMLKTPPPA